MRSFYLAPHDGKPLPPYQPGQYLTFELKIPGHRAPVIRCYSLSDSPNHPDYYRISVKKILPPPEEPDGPPGISSSYFNDVVREGDILDVKAPMGHFYLQPESPMVMVGGGIGVTPLLSMLNTLCEDGHTGEIWFFYGVRNSDEHMMKEHLDELALNHPNLHLHFCYSQPLESDVLGRDYHTAGFASVELMRQLLPSNNYTFYICGPAPMMESIVNGLDSWGVPENHIHFEAFGQATVRRATMPEPAEAGPPTQAVMVSFSRSDKTLLWHPSDGSLLDLAEDNGIAMDFACRTGNCGTCVTAIMSGKVAYMMKPGHQVEDGSCLACVGVPEGPVTLDA